MFLLGLIPLIFMVLVAVRLQQIRDLMFRQNEILLLLVEAVDDQTETVTADPSGV